MSPPSKGPTCACEASLINWGRSQNEERQAGSSWFAHRQRELSVDSWDTHTHTHAMVVTHSQCSLACGGENGEGDTMSSSNGTKEKMDSSKQTDKYPSPFHFFLSSFLTSCLPLPFPSPFPSPFLFPLFPPSSLPPPSSSQSCLTGFLLLVCSRTLERLGSGLLNVLLVHNDRTVMFKSVANSSMLSY